MSRKSYTVKEKLNILSKLNETHSSISTVARENNISNKMLRDWIKKYEKLVCTANKTTTRHVGSGRSAFFPEIEEKIYDWIVIERKVNKRIITYKNIRDKALKFAEENKIENFCASNGWIERFLNRKNLVSRKITSVGQEDNRSSVEIRQTVLNYFEEIQQRLGNVENLNVVLNMDETPIYIDMMNSRTISFKGEKNTEACGTGHEKTRLTVVLCLANDGEFLKTMIILKGLKRVPKVQIPSNIYLTTSRSGTMDSNIMQKWCKTCLNVTGPFKNNQKRFLILDSYGAHKEEQVVKEISNQNTTAIFIPPKTTSFLQPLDVLINATFKSLMKEKWSEWMINGEKEYTKKGYRKKPSWDFIINSISKSVKSIKKDICKKSFVLCGIENGFVHLNEEKLNLKLKKILNPEENIQTELAINSCESQDSFQ